jgi:hypothetical protein
MFEDIRSRFQLPKSVDFASPDGSIISIDVPSDLNPQSSEESVESSKLAYTSNNVPIHTYTEELSRLLVSLDAVESWGGKNVRVRRKEIVRRVEQEARRVEIVLEAVWRASRNPAPVVQEDVPVVEMTEDEGIKEEPTVPSEGALEGVSDAAHVVEEDEVARLVVPEPEVMEVEDRTDRSSETASNDETKDEPLPDDVVTIEADVDVSVAPDDWTLVPLPEDL